MNRCSRLAIAVTLLLALFAGQVHACYTVWKLPGGEECVTCPDLLTDRKAERETVSAQKSDCLDCCTAADDCGDEGLHDSDFSKAGPHFAVVLPDAFRLKIPEIVTDAEGISIHVQSFLPNGPPDHHSSRAPPAPL